MQVGALGANKAQRAEVERLLNGLAEGDERALLRLFREEATTLVLQVRVWVEERRAEREAQELMEDEEVEWPSEEEEAEAKEELGRQYGLPV